MGKTYGLKIGEGLIRDMEFNYNFFYNGDGFIRDLMNPRPEELDLAAIKERLMRTKRFTNNPRALSVYEHTIIVEQIAMTLMQHPKELHGPVTFWCRHHDTHEGIIGDIPGPLKTLIQQHTSILDVIEAGIDQALCARLAHPAPTNEVRAIVHDYDKMAETLEWVHVLGEPLEPWNYPLDPKLTPELCKGLIHMVRNL